MDEKEMQIQLQNTIAECKSIIDNTDLTLVHPPKKKFKSTINRSKTQNIEANTDTQLQLQKKNDNISKKKKNDNDNTKKDKNKNNNNKNKNDIDISETNVDISNIIIPKPNIDNSNINVTNETPINIQNNASNTNIDIINVKQENINVNTKQDFAIPEFDASQYKVTTLNLCSDESDDNTNSSNDSGNNYDNDNDVFVEQENVSSDDIDIDIEDEIKETKKKKLDNTQNIAKKDNEIKKKKIITEELKLQSETNTIVGMSSDEDNIFTPKSKKIIKKNKPKEQQLANVSDTTMETSIESDIKNKKLKKKLWKIEVKDYELPKHLSKVEKILEISITKGDISPLKKLIFWDKLVEWEEMRKKEFVKLDSDEQKFRKQRIIQLISMNIEWVNNNHFVDEDSILEFANKYYGKLKRHKEFTFFENKNYYNLWYQKWLRNLTKAAHTKGNKFFQFLGIYNDFISQFIKYCAKKKLITDEIVNMITYIYRHCCADCNFVSPTSKAFRPHVVVHYNENNFKSLMEYYKKKNHDFDEEKLMEKLRGKNTKKTELAKIDEQ